ncbi:MAG: hypothetical protein P8X55_16495, partial [Desulfosarcinaceae bacterium]
MIEEVYHAIEEPASEPIHPAGLAALPSAKRVLLILLCTGFTSKLTQKEAKEMGVKALLEKPLVAEHLAVLVRQVLDEKRS